MILSARLVQNPQNTIYCSECNRSISKNAIRLYGMAHPEEKPHILNFHYKCINSNDKKVIRVKTHSKDKSCQ